MIRRLIILLLLCLLTSCSFIEMTTGFGGMMMPVIIIQRTVNKIEKICKKECKKNNEYSADWCDCMGACLNSDDKWDVAFEGYWIWDNEYTTTTIEEGSVNVTLNECPLDSIATN